MGNDYTRECNEVRSKISQQESEVHRLGLRLNDNSHNVDVARINQKNLNAELASQHARLNTVIAQQQKMIAGDAALHRADMIAVQSAHQSVRLEAFKAALDADKPIPAFRPGKY